jgi:hypothetical protein
VDVGVAPRVVVDVDVGLVGAVGPARDLLPATACGVVDGPLDRGLDYVGTGALGELAEAPGPEASGADLGSEVARERGDAVVGLERKEQVASLLAPVDDLHRGPARALAVDLVDRDVVAARHAATRVGVVALDRGDAQKTAVSEARRVHVVVGQVASPVVGVVAQEHVAVVPLLRPEELEREAHGQRRLEHELGDADAEGGEAPPRVEDRRVALVGLVEDRRHRGPAHEHRHLEADGLHGGADDGSRHGVDRRYRAAWHAAWPRVRVRPPGRGRRPARRSPRGSSSARRTGRPEGTPR